MKKVFRKNLNQQLRKRRTRAPIFGTAARPRLSVFRSLRYMSGQLIDDANHRTLLSASSRVLHKTKIAKTAAAQEAGKALGAMAKKAGIHQALFDRGAYRYHGRVKAFAEGCREAGLTI